LIHYFGGQQEIKRASVQQLQKVNGISKSLARDIYDYIHAS
jgi:excinuclease ABC subunit C